MKKLSFLLFTVLFVTILTSCGSSVDKIDTNEEEEVQPKTNDEKEVEENLANSEDIWTYYDDATYEETWEGVKFNIEKVVVSDEAPGFDDNGDEIISSAVGVKMTVENLTEDEIYTTYPDQALLVTSTGEQIDADMLLSDHLGGEIHEGVIKQGDIYFYLERGSALEIDWVKLNWDSSYEDPSGDYEKDIYEEHSVKLELK